MSDSDAERVEWMVSNPSKFPFSVYPPTRHDILFDARRSYPPWTLKILNQPHVGRYTIHGSCARETAILLSDSNLSLPLQH